MEQISFTLGEVEYSVKMTLRLWLELQEIDKKIADFMRGKSMLEASASICSYLSVVTKLDTEIIKTFFWMDIANAYVTIRLGCIPEIDFPLLHSKSDSSPITWDYDGRTWYLWSHLLASEYGWTPDIIENLYFEDAIAYIQEILIDDQLTKEWQWSLSELAYPYNQATRKSEFKALPRPSWMTGMQRLSKPIETSRLPIDMIPTGLVLKWEQNEKVVN